MFDSPRSSKGLRSSGFLFHGESLLDLQLMLSGFAGPPFHLGLDFVLFEPAFSLDAFADHFVLSEPLLIESPDSVFLILLLGPDFLCLFEPQILSLAINPFDLYSSGKCEIPFSCNLP